MKLKAKHGVVEVKSLGLRLTANSTEEELKQALKLRPDLAQFIDGATTKNQDGKK